LLIGIGQIRPMANKDHFRARLGLARAAVAPKVPVAYLFTPERGHFHIRAILEEDLPWSGAGRALLTRPTPTTRKIKALAIGLCSRQNL